MSLSTSVVSSTLPPIGDGGCFALSIPLTQDKIALVDGDDYARLTGHTWHAQYQRGRWYAATKIGGKNVYMHNLILGIKEVDHIDHDGLNNKRLNLRPCTRTQNNGNMRPRTGASSRFKGVSWYKPYGKWMVYINKDYVRTFIGYFEDELLAAKAYNDVATRLYGDFAHLNEI